MENNNNNNSSKPPQILGSITGSITTCPRNSGSEQIQGLTMTGSFEEAANNNNETVPPSNSDEELRLAQAMAMAIQSNPNLSPEELKLLMASQQQQQLVQQAKKKSWGQKAGFSKAKAFFDSVKQTTTKYIDNESVASNKATTESGIQSQVPQAATDKGSSSSLEITTTKIPSTTTPTVVKTIATDVVVMQQPPVSPTRTKSPPVIVRSPRAFKNNEDSSKLRLSARVWKRRSGLGKYSVTAAWERRRLELRGNKLSYFKEYNEENSTDDVIVPTLPDLETTAQNNQEVVVVQAKKPTSWFEQATAAFQGDMPDASNNLNAPRGCMDLLKEKATVAAATGHSGAPTPFAISIKVRGETKWKFCFDVHCVQMEWLAALTDVVVQGSVDEYNSQLLEAVNPTEQHIVMPHVNEPPSVENNNSGHRLWMLEDYMIKSQENIIQDGDKAATEQQQHLPEMEMENTAATRDVDAAVVAAVTPTKEDIVETDDDKKKPPISWSIPDKHLHLLVAVLNVSLVMARASTTTLDQFWTILSIANFSLFILAVKEVERAEKQQNQKQGTIMPTGNQTTHAAPSAKPKTLAPATKQKTAAAKSGFVPLAGTTAIKLENPKDPPANAKGEMFAAWRPVPGETLLVRSHGYLKTKKKVGSPGELYKLAQVDVFESPHRYPDMATRVVLPKVDDIIDDGSPKTWHTPDIFVISIALPTDPPKLTGSTPDDGGGYTITMYFTMLQETRDILKRVTAEDYDPSAEPTPNDVQKSKVNAVRLLEEWCRRAPADPKFQSRFKLVPKAHNLKEIGMPDWIARYNNKPCLIKRPGQTGFLFRHPQLSCMEFDISLHPFPYLAKRAICFMKDTYFAKVLVTFGFVIEGRSDDELPECLIGLMQLCYPNPEYAIQAADFFAGKCAKSY